MRILPVTPNPVPGPTYLKRDDINQSYSACAYCGWPKRDNFACCGEIHFELVHELMNGELVRSEDSVIIEDMWNAMQEDYDR